MNRTGRYVAGAIGALIILGLLWILLGPKPNDQEQIKEALNNAIQASKEGRPGGVLDYIADTIEVNGAKYRSGQEVANAIKKYKPDVKVQKMDPVVNGDKGTITSDVQLSIAIKTISIPNVTFKFGKEQGHKWLVVPTNDWKLEGVDLPQESVDAIVGQIVF